MPPDPQGNARLLAKINFPISGKLVNIDINPLNGNVF